MQTTNRLLSFVDDIGTECGDLPKVEVAPDTEVGDHVVDADVQVDLGLGLFAGVVSIVSVVWHLMTDLLFDVTDVDIGVT